MRTRTPVLAIALLAVALLGCQVTVQSRVGSLAPESLIGYRLDLANTDRGGPLAEHPGSSRYLVPDRVAYQFKSEREAFDGELNPASEWSYDRRTGTVTITFAYDERSDLIGECRLTFKDRVRGTHRCEWVIEGVRTVRQQVSQSGWGTGSFVIEGL